MIQAETHRRKIPSVKLPAPLSAALFLFIGVFIFLSTAFITPRSAGEMLGEYFNQPLLILLNGFPVFVLLTVMWAISANVFFSGAATLVITDVLSYINLLKIEGRDDPFVPADVMLVREGITAAGDYEMQLHLGIIAAISGCAIIFIILGIFFRTARPRPVFRAVAGVAVCVCFAVSMPTVYADKEIYDSFTVPNKYNITSVYNTLGFNYCFLHNFNLYSVDKPENYSRAEVERWAEEDTAPETEPEVQPNVLFVMCEAFSDIANDPAFDYPDGGENPLTPFNLLAADLERAYSGHLVVSDFGAGTANTEFDVLTGMPTRMLSETTTSAFRVVRRDINTVPRLFERNGYQTYFMHPGNSWFYNRFSVYSHFGIDRQVFKNDAFTEDDYKGNMISDEAFLRVLKRDWSAMVQEKEPVFAYTVTIQNHQAYNVWKYNDDSILEAVPSSREMTGNDRAILNVYLYGLSDSAKMLYSLTEYLDTVDEPTMLVFFGDHRPTLGSDYSVYRALGMQVGQTDTAQGMIETNKTPFLLWANKSYASGFTERIESLELPENGTISSHYLGAAVTELVGYAGKDGYYDFLNNARRILPVVCSSSYMRPDGTFPDELTDEEQNVVDKTHGYLYYRMKEESLIGE